MLNIYKHIIEQYYQPSLVMGNHISDKFEKDKGVSAELKIVKVYPVNYQIASNTDIFTLLKYDILLQLLVNDMVSESSIKGVFLDREDGTEFLTGRSL